MSTQQWQTCPACGAVVSDAEAHAALHDFAAGSLGSILDRLDALEAPPTIDPPQTPEAP